MTEEIETDTEVEEYFQELEESLETDSDGTELAYMDNPVVSVGDSVNATKTIFGRIRIKFKMLIIWADH